MLKGLRSFIGFTLRNLSSNHFHCREQQGKVIGRIAEMVIFFQILYCRKQKSKVSLRVLYSRTTQVGEQLKDEEWVNNFLPF